MGVLSILAKSQEGADECERGQGLVRSVKSLNLYRNKPVLKESQIDIQTKLVLCGRARKLQEKGPVK